MHQPWQRTAKLTELLLPFMEWMRAYSSKQLRGDFIAGMTVAVVLTPQAMAYALLAGLPPIVGFYAALVGAVIASLWGASRQLSTGPVAIVSFLVFTALVPLAEPGSEKFVALAAGLAILSGLMLFFVGLFRFGFLMRLIPHSVIIGFEIAAALIIAVIQLPSLLGFEAERTIYMLPSLWNIGGNLIEFHWMTALVGLVALVALLLLKWLRPRWPGALIVLITAVVTSFVLGLDGRGVDVIGTIPAVLPSFAMPDITLHEWFDLLSRSWVIALVGFVETYAIAKSIASRTKQHVDVDQELVAQGLANIAAGFFRGYPVSASFSRTAINVAAGAQTGIASVIAAGAVLLILFLVSPILYYIPLTVLAAIVIVSILDLIDLRRLRELYRLSRTDGIVAVTAFVTACVLRPYDAILIGVIVALSLTIHRIVWARVRKLGLETEWRILQAVGTSPTVQTFPGVLMVRAETSAFYGNIEYIISRIDEYIMSEEQSGTFVKTLVLECSSINYMDLAGAELLHEYAVSLKATGTSVYAIYVHSGVQDRLERIGALDDIILVHNINELMRMASITEPARDPAPGGSTEEKIVV